LNGIPISENLYSAVKAYRKGEYAFFGYYMGSVLKLVAEPKEEEPIKDVEEIFTRGMAT
jgi:hypothetical protein